MVACPHPLWCPLEGDPPPGVVSGALVVPHALQRRFEVVAAEHVVYTVALIPRRAGRARVPERW
eukprot:2644154-Prymnesium_polylepis.1